MTLITTENSTQKAEVIDILKKVADILHLKTGVLTVYYHEGGVRGDIKFQETIKLSDR